MKSLLLALAFALAVGVAIAQINPNRQAGDYIAAAYNYDIDSISGSGLGAPGSYTFTVGACQNALPFARNRNLNPFSTNASVLIQDVNSANTETVAFLSQSLSNGYCVLLLAATKPHNSYHLKSGTYGLQEAINDATSTGGGNVVVDSQWGGTTAMITGAAGNATVSITDNRVGSTQYAWNGSNYIVSGGGGGGGGTWGSITGTLSNQTDLQNALNLKATLISPALTGFPTAPTQPNGTNNGTIASTQFVLNQIGVGGGVSSFNTRVGAVVPASGDYTFSQIGTTPTTLGGYGITDAVPNTRTVAGHALSSNVSIAFADIITTPTTLAGYGITDGVSTSRTVNGKALSANITLDLSSSDFSGQTLAGARMPALTGDVTSTVNTVATTVVKINGNSITSGAANNQTMICTAANTCVWKTIPDCVSSSNALNFTQSTNVFSCLSIATLTNPMTTLGDVIYGGASGAVTRLAGPTTPNGIPQSLISTPSGGSAVAPTWSIPGVAIDAQVGTSYTLLATDDVHLLTISNGSAVALAGTNMLTNNYVFSLYNLGAGLGTYTAASGTVNGSGGTAIIPQWWFGFHYTDNTNTIMPIMPTLKAFPNCTDATGNHLNFTAATGALSCGTSVPASVALTANRIDQNNAATTSAQFFSVISDESGTGVVAGTTSPVFTTPTLGAATATTINKVTLTQPATGSTVTVVDGKTLTDSNTIDVAKTAGAAGGIVWADTTTSYSTVAAGTAKQLILAGGATTPTYLTFPNTSYSPAANCVNSVAGSAWSTGAVATPAALCRAGTNNKAGLLSPWGASDVGYIQFHIDADTDLTTALPQLLLELTSTDATNGHTIIMQESVGCAKEDGTTTDDVAFNAARSMATVTLNGNANRTWKTTLALNSTDMTGCAAPGLMWVKISRTTDTATNVGVYGLSLTQFRLLATGAN